jgi:hypothetical protein
MSPLEARRLGQKNGREVVRKHTDDIREAGDLRAQLQEARELEAYGPGRESYYHGLAKRMSTSLFGDYDRGLNDGIRAALRSKGRGRTKAIVRAPEDDLEMDNPWVIGGIVVVGAVILITLMAQPRPQSL